VGITARVLSDLGWLDSDEGRVILGAAVIDDIIGLIILAVVAAAFAGAALSIGSISRIAGVAVAFVALAVILGSLIAPASASWSASAPRVRWGCSESRSHFSWRGWRSTSAPR
jgi:Kef-type K+ transport system membrane component KefB